MKNIFDISYKSKLDLMETQVAIKFVKDSFQKELVKGLNLLRVTAPLFVLKNSGLNDNLSGVENPVYFTLENKNEEIEIIHSLAKWKRMALQKYGFVQDTGLYTDMNAIRKDEKLDFIHSLYVDQWDWERVISDKQRSLSYLKKMVKKIYKALLSLEKKVSKKYPCLKKNLPENITFISTEELEKRYPTLSRKEREDQITREYKAVFIYHIGWPLKDGESHDTRAADYDDWNLNGDILLYNEMYDMALEISSMGIRVDEKSLVKQLEYKNELSKLNNEYCQKIINKELPLTIGGGIGQSRLCMYFLDKAHIGEVQVSIWSQKEIDELKSIGIELL